MRVYLDYFWYDWSLGHHWLRLVILGTSLLTLNTTSVKFCTVAQFGTVWILMDTDKQFRLSLHLHFEVFHEELTL